MSGTPEDLAVEVQRLRAERDELQSKLAEPKPPRRRGRAVASVLLVILAILSLAAATPGAWARRTLLDTDRYVATVAPLASDPAVQEALAREITAAVFEALNVQDRVQGLLRDRAPRLGFISGPITEGLQGFVQDQVLKVVQSDLFLTSWTGANRVLHSQAISALEGKEGVISTENGTVTFNYLPLVNESLKAMGSLVSDLVGKTVSLPEIDADTVPAEAVAKIEAVTGVDLPDTFGSVVLYRSDQFASAQKAFDLFNRGVFLLIFVFAAATAGALWLSSRRRRTLLQLVVGFAVVLVIERRFAIAGTAAIVGDAKPENQAAVRAVLDSVLASLLVYTGWLLATAASVAAIALLFGPYPWATALRRGSVDLARGIAGTASEASESGVAAWIASHRDAMMLGGAAIGVIVLLILDLSPAGLLLVAALLGAFELVVWRSAETRATPDG